jgi:hypothetical protein
VPYEMEFRDMPRCGVCHWRHQPPDCTDPATEWEFFGTSTNGGRVWWAPTGRELANTVFGATGTGSNRPGIPMCDPQKPNAQSPVPHNYQEVKGQHAGPGGRGKVMECRRCGRRAVSVTMDEG